MSATDYEQELAQTSGVLLKTWAQPHSIEVENGAVAAMTFEYTRNDEQDQLVGTGEVFQIPADMVFKAIGQRFVPPQGLENETTGLKYAGNRFEVDDNRRTSLPDVYAGGDCIPGQDLTVAAVQDGKLAAEAINTVLQEKASG